MVKAVLGGVALVALLAGCAGGGVPSASGWREVDSPHFRVYTDLDSGEAQETARSLERYREAILAWYDDALDPPARVVAVVYAGPSAFRARGAGKWGGFWSPWFGGRLLVSTRAQTTGYGLALAEPDAHELAHELNAYFLLRQPRWLSEGLASYLSTITVEDGRARYGRPAEPWRWWLREHRPLPLSTLWAWEHEDNETLSQSAIWDRYVSSALWVDFLDNERGVRFDDFRRRLKQAEAPRAAFDAAFANVDEKALQGELETFVSRIFPVRQRPLPAAPIAVKERALSKAEVAELEARVWYQAPGNEPKAAREAYVRSKIAEAIALDPKLISARYLDAALAPKGERLARAKALTEAAPRSALAWQLYGNRLPKGDPRALEALEKAVALAPKDATVLADAAEAEVRAGHAADALANAQRADALAPWDPGVAHTRADAEWLAKDCAHAVADEARAIDMLYDGQAPALRRRLQTELEDRRSKCPQTRAP